MRLLPRSSSFKSALVALSLAVAAAALPGASARADATTQTTSPVVARVGARVITAADLERRIASVPPFQLRGFGRTAAEVRRNFLDRVMIREILFAEGAADQKIAELPEVQDRIRGLLRGVMIGSIRQNTAASSPISAAEVRAYYEANRAKYNTPARVAVWRIVVASEQDARAVIDDMKKDLTPKRWTDIAREKSLDKTNNMRSGNLGFVSPDGSTTEPEIKVGAEVLAAVNAVKDGELVPEPVKEEGRFAVLWRRQSIKAVTRTPEQEDLSIRQILSHTKIEAAIKSLIEALRKDNVSTLNVELVDSLEITASGDLQQQKRPGTLPASRRPGTARPVPVQGPGGLR